MPRILHASEARSLRGRLSSFDRAALSLRLADDYAQLPSLSPLPSPTPNEHVSDVRYDAVGALRRTELAQVRQGCAGQLDHQAV